MEASPNGASPIFGGLILICHRSLLSAASLTAQSQPDDGAAITRRAVEAARTALAIKLDSQNFERWISFQDRRKRWLMRIESNRPKTFQVGFESIKGEPLINDLDDLLGILSDSAVHFTPEFYTTLDWDVRRGSAGDGAIFLNYFHRDPREIERSLIFLSATHLKIFEVFDRCLDGTMLSHPQIREVWSTFRETARRLNAEYQQRLQIR